MTRHRIVPPLVAALLVLAACGKDPSDAPPPSKPAPTTAAAPATSTPGTGGTATTAGTTSGTTNGTAGEGTAAGGTAAGSSTPATKVSASGSGASFHGKLAEASSGGQALSYDATAAPVGAELAVDITSANGKTTYQLTVTGMAADRGYAVHAHVKACGASGEAAGPHFQHKKDPAATAAKPSSDPAYANPQNEIWLELQTDGEGSGTATTTVPFAFEQGDAPQSIVVHANPTTMTEPGKAGMAGARIACLSTPLE